jgi:hypothetical protein
MRKNVKKIIMVVGLVFFVSSMFALAASRHTQEEAPVRFTKTVIEGQTLTKTISCYDPDGDPVTIEVVDLPNGAEVSQQIDAPEGYTDPDLPPVPDDAPNTKWYTRTLTWTPSFAQSGTHTIYIHATDSHGDDDWVKYEITVTDVNRPPVL